MAGAGPPLPRQDLRSRRTLPHHHQTDGRYRAGSALFLRGESEEQLSYSNILQTPDDDEDEFPIRTPLSSVRRPSRVKLPSRVATRLPKRVQYAPSVPTRLPGKRPRTSSRQAKSRGGLRTRPLFTPSVPLRHRVTKPEFRYSEVPARRPQGLRHFEGLLARRTLRRPTNNARLFRRPSFPRPNIKPTVGILVGSLLASKLSGTFGAGKVGITPNFRSDSATVKTSGIVAKLGEASGTASLVKTIDTASAKASIDSAQLADSKGSATLSEAEDTATLVAKKDTATPQVKKDTATEESDKI